MSFLLDTNIVAAYSKGDPKVFSRFVQHSGGLSTSTLCAGELYSWVYRAKTNPKHFIALQNLISEINLLPVDFEVALKFGEVRAALLDQGRPTPEMDLLIGCMALVHDLTVVTRNVEDFSHISALRIEDWLA